MNSYFFLTVNKLIQIDNKKYENSGNFVYF